MKVSVLVPVYNKSENELTRCFESILNQTCKDFELIITDDGSNCEVAKFLDEYAENNKMRCTGGVYCYRYRNSGVWTARNHGQEKASGEWIMHVNADDYINPITIETALKAANEHVNADMIYWGWTCAELPLSLYRGYGGDRLYMDPINVKFQIPRDMLYATPFCDVTCMVRRENMQSFNPKLFGAEFEHQVRTVANCRAVYFVDLPFYSNVSSNNTISSKVDLNWRVTAIKDFRDALLAYKFKTIDEYLAVYAVGVIHVVTGQASSVLKVTDKKVISTILRSTTVKEFESLTRMGRVVFALFKARLFILLNILLWIMRKRKKSYD